MRTHGIGVLEAANSASFLIASLSLATAAWQLMQVVSGGKDMSLLFSGLTWQLLHTSPNATWSLWLNGIGWTRGGCGARFDSIATAVG
jgi:hypothetical protein